MALLVGECDIGLGYWKGKCKWAVNALKLQSHQCHEMETKKPHKCRANHQILTQRVRGLKLYLSGSGRDLFNFSNCELRLLTIDFKCKVFINFFPNYGLAKR